MLRYFICTICCLYAVGLKANTSLTDSLMNRLQMQADSAVKAGEYQAALAYYGMALRATTPGFTDTTRLSNPDWKLLANLHNKSHILNLLFAKAQVLLSIYDKNGEAAMLRKAYESFQLIDRLADNIKSDNMESLSQKRIAATYRLAIKTASSIFKKTKNELHFEQAFQWAERCKTLLLTDLLRSLQTKNLQAIPDSLLAYGKQFRDQLSELEKKISRTVQPILQDSLRALQSEYKTFSTQLKKDFPGHFVQHNHEVTSLDQLRGKVLKDDMVLLEYFVGEEAVFLFEITKDDVQLSEIELDFPLKELVNDLTKAVNVPDDNAADYAATASKLYKHLRPISQKENCIIVPDGILQQLPFELLLTEEPTAISFKTFPYLLRKVNISYAYSATDLVRRHKGLPINIGKQFLGVSNNDPDNKDEILQIIRKLDGEVLTDSPALLADFKNKASKFDIIHLAVQADEDGIILNNQSLALNELYEQKTEASMVVLNSYASPDIIPMEQALSNKSESVVLARWNTQAAASADIMKRFYTHLGEKMTKSAALRQAKLDYLSENYVNEKMAHPYYWAAWSPFGNMLPLEIQILIEDFIGLAVGLIMLLLIIAYFLRRSSSDIPVGTITNFPARG